MPNFFTIIIITLFFWSSGFEAFSGHAVKAWFYFFSAAINLTVLFMR